MKKSTIIGLSFLIQSFSATSIYATNTNDNYVMITNQLTEVHYSGPLAGKFIPLDLVAMGEGGSIIIHYGETQKVYASNNNGTTYPQIGYRGSKTDGTLLGGYMNGAVSYVGHKLPMSVTVTTETSPAAKFYKYENPDLAIKGYLTPTN